MNYELVNVLRADTENWKHQKQRAQESNSKLITLAPDPFFLRKHENDYSTMINVVDTVTKRTYDQQQSLFFNKVPTVAGAQIFMNADGVTSIIKNGERIGKLRLFPGTRRLVQDVTYYNGDGTRDLIEEYTFDGQLYSNIFYYQDQVQEIAFFDNQQNVRLRFHFYEGSLNLITIENPVTHEVTEKYDSMAQFQAAQVAKIVGPEDHVGIGYLGIELDALSKTKSTNTLYLDEPAFDGDQLKGNLKLIIENNISYIQQVVVRPEDYQRMLEQGIDVTKVKAK
jgi:hypothetical protein